MNVADLWISGDTFESDASLTTRTSWVGAVAALLVVSTSFVILLMGINPKFYFSDGVTSVSGDRKWNIIGWVLGAVVTPLIVVVAHQVELRRALSPDHIKVSSRNKLLGIFLFMGLVVSTFHAFLGSVSIKFGG